jgi:hypothetical protein
MVAVKGFPRPLYPPDAGRQPTIDGSDVEAYKRTVSRAGRWPWQTFDQAFSNGFAHGTSGDVGSTGVAGVQRQLGFDADTGWIGPATFNALRSIRIPDGLPNAGQTAMDTRAVELINAAFDRFGGFEPPAIPPRRSALARLARAQTQIGVHESPFRSNRQKYGAWYGFDGVPWCAIFATWCDQTGPFPSPAFERGRRYSYVPDIVSAARRGIAGLYQTSTPEPGDLVCYDWARDGTFDHVGIFEGGTALRWSAIEGNTGTIDFSNGGEVMRTNRSATQAGIVFVRAVEP